jgi:hypothetical protein
MTTIFFHPSLLLLFLDPGSEIQDKHSGSATLLLQILKYTPVSWIRIRSDRHHFAGSGSISTKCNPRSFQYTIQTYENYDTYDADEK